MSTIDTEYVEKEEILKVIEVFIQEMKSSGYTREQSREIVIGGIKGWKRKVERRKKEGLGFYRLAKSTLPTRVRKKLMERETWYKEKIDDNEEDKDYSNKSESYKINKSKINKKKESEKKK